MKRSQNDFAGLEVLEAREVPASLLIGSARFSAIGAPEGTNQIIYLPETTSPPVVPPPNSGSPVAITPPGFFNPTPWTPPIGGAGG